MTLEARVQALEENQAEWNKVLTGIEGSVALILKELIDLKKDHEVFKIETRNRFDQMTHEFNAAHGKFKGVNERFDQLELLIRQHFTSG
ncbi:MAG: hypothetical protein ACR2PT_06870 [Endozoicomonas sp.]